MNAQPPPRTSLQGARFAVCFIDLGQKVDGAFVVLSADLRQAYPACRAVQEPHAQSILKVLNVAADHRSRDIEVTGRGREAGVLDDADEGGDAVQTIHATLDCHAIETSLSRGQRIIAAGP